MIGWSKNQDPLTNLTWLNVAECSVAFCILFAIFAARLGESGYVGRLSESAHKKSELETDGFQFAFDFAKLPNCNNRLACLTRQRLRLLPQALPLFQREPLQRELRQLEPFQPGQLPRLNHQRKE